MIVAVTYGFTSHRDGPNGGFSDFIRSLAGARPAFFEWHDSVCGWAKKNRDETGLALIGHSYGGDKSSEVARTLAKQGIVVDLLIMLDPVHRWGLGDFTIPIRNVLRAYDHYNPKKCHDPFWSFPIGNPSATNANITIDIGHGDFLTDLTVRRLVYQAWTLAVANRAVIQARQSASIPTDHEIHRR